MWPVIKPIRGKPYIHACIYTYSDYMVRVISISDEVYMQLYNIKEGRSFTQVIRSLLAERTDKKGSAKELERFFGIITKGEADKWKKEIEEGRKNFGRNRPG